MSREGHNSTAEIERPEALLPGAARAVELARKAGAEWADASVSLSRGLNVVVEKSSIKSAEADWSRHLSIRAYVGGGMGYVSSSGAAASDLAELAEKAVALARSASPDPDFAALPDPQSPSRIPVTFDPKILSLTADDIIGWTCGNLEAARGVRSDAIISGDAAFSAGAGAFASSSGIRIARNSTSVYLSFFAVVKDGSDVGSFADHTSARFLDDFDPSPELAARITRRALEYRKARRVPTGRTTLVLGPRAAFDLVADLVSAASAESIQRRRSLLVDRLDGTIGSELLTVTDDGLIDRGLYSGPYDAEGAARRVVTVFDRGRFNAALHNSYTAHKAKTQNTGHGQRTGGISSTNLQIARGEHSAAELIGEVEDGVYLEIGSLDPDLTSGDVSTSLDFAFKIEKGELAYPVANAMVGGSLLELLGDLDAVSADYRDDPGNPKPTIRIRDVQISSEGD
ncbi:MAG: TldD/PmbA family protein [Phycisphaerae bacterium]|nr:TldD/PmbA family protein [Phycisphaerae bacterium]